MANENERRTQQQDVPPSAEKRDPRGPNRGIAARRRPKNNNRAAVVGLLAPTLSAQLPAGTTYQAGSLTLGDVPMTDAADGDAAAVVTPDAGGDAVLIPPPPGRVRGCGGRCGLATSRSPYPVSTKTSPFRSVSTNKQWQTRRPVSPILRPSNNAPPSGQSVPQLR